MTDVSKLQGLAGAISSASPAIRKAALAQAAATVSQEADIQKQWKEIEMLKGSGTGTRPGGGGGGGGNPAFGTRTEMAGASIYGQSNVVITGKTFRTLSNGRSLDLQGCSNITITDCDFDNGGGIYLLNCTGVLTLTNLRMRNVGHNGIQLDKSVMSGLVSLIRVKGGLSEDVISVFAGSGSDSGSPPCGGPSAGSPLIFDDIKVEGGDGVTTTRWVSGSGSGFMCERAQNVHFRNYTLLNPGQVGIGTHRGTNVRHYDFSIHTEQSYPSRGLGDIAVDAAETPVTNPLEISRGKVKWYRADGSQANFTVDSAGVGIIGYDSPQTNFVGYNFSPAEIAAMRVVL